MKLKLHLTSFLVLILFFQTFGWGQTGHRTIGLIAEMHLTKKAKKKIYKILDNESLADVSTWMDEIRSNREYDHTHDWHWVSIPDGLTYETSTKNKNGDIIVSIQRLIEELKNNESTVKNKTENIKMLVHLIGDLHMPLHVGNGKDKGGNDKKVKYFGKNTNLHTVWDSNIIMGKEYSYTELAHYLVSYNKKNLTEWKNNSVLDWAYESMDYREKVYDLPNDDNIRYAYVYKNWPTVCKRLTQAGIRLANVLNEIYG